MLYSLEPQIDHWALFVHPSPRGKQDDISLFNFWEYYSDIDNSLYKHFVQLLTINWNQENRGRQFNYRYRLAGKATLVRENCIDHWAVSIKPH
jgi:hypothetical protein